MNILQVDLAHMLRDTGAFPFDRWSDDAGDIIYTIEGLAAITYYVDVHDPACWLCRAESFLASY